MHAARAALTAAAALAMTAPPAFAQYQGQYQGQYQPPYSDPVPAPAPAPQSQYDQSRYQADRAAYEQQRRDYEAARARFCPHEDGQACARTAAFFFDDAPETRVAHLDVEYWPIMDPAGLAEGREAKLNLYRGVRDQIRKRMIERFGEPGEN